MRRNPGLVADESARRGGSANELVSGISGAVKARARLRWLVADAAQRLAEMVRSESDLITATSAAERGVAIDPYCDALWTLLIDSLEVSGEIARSKVLQKRRASVFEELGLIPDPHMA
jgi:DNA-binding SARP family transcriptional activator